MNAVLFGLLSAAGLGTADFMARFSARSLGAPLAYAAVLLVGAVASSLWMFAGGTQLVWLPLIGRWTGLIGVVTMLMLQRVRLTVPRSWLPFLAAQGLLDFVGFAAFLMGSTTATPHITMVVSSSFSVFTVILAKLVLKEPISGQQWCAIGLIAAGSAALAGTV